MISPRGRFGNSLLETIMALFLLAAATLLIISLFHTALQRSRWSEQQTSARQIAERTLAEMRRWSAQGNFLESQDLVSWDGKKFPDPTQPEFEVAIRARMATLTSPCESLEVVYPLAQRRRMTRSAAQVQVTVSWSGGRAGLSRVALNSLLPESPRKLQSVTVTGSSGPLAAGASSTFTAQAYDASGRPIHDIVYVWWVEAQTGNGQITPAHAGDSAVFVNQGRRSDGTAFQTGGICRVAALATYEGVEVIGYSSDVQLQP